MQDDFKELQKECDERIKAHGVRVAGLEYLFTQNLERIDDKVSKLYDKVEILNDFIELVKKVLDQQKGRFSPIESDMVSIRTSCDRHHGTLDKEIHSLETELSKLFEKQSKLEKDNQKFSSIIEKLTEQLLFFDKLHSTFHCYSKEKDSQIQSMDKKLDRLQSQIDFLSQTIKDLQLRLNISEEVLKRVSTQSEDSRNICKQEHSLIREEINRSVKCLQTQIDAELADIFIPDVSHFIREEELVKMKHEVAVSAIEAKNAYTKATNVEMQQAISSKKLENVQLKINQFELKNQ